MANNYYEIYLDDIISLAATMVIKSHTSAVATNRELLYFGVDVSDDPATWRYYMNIAGLYHSTNEEMIVKSIDTQEDIAFTKENLAIHRATARAYAYGTDYYRALVSQFELQETLILGILNPVDLQTAIDAPDGKILWMDPAYVDENETILQEQIQYRINSFFDRWHVPDYSATEDLYDTARYQIGAANLAGFIFTARLENCHTLHAHSFHIRQFLASNGRLDIYFDAMNLKQRLFFYRNLPYIHRYPGATDTFNWLVDNVMVERGFPLAQYTMNHNIANMPNELDPQIELIRTETTPDYAGVPATVHSVLEVLTKELPLARSNAAYLSDHEASTTMLMQLGKDSSVSTKVLESKVVDRTDSQVFTMAEVLLNHWLYLSTVDRYRAVITILNPRTGADIKMPVQDAFILYLYAYNRANGMVLENIPNIDALRVRRHAGPSVGDLVLRPVTIEELMSVVDPRLVPKEMAVLINSLAYPISSYVSTEAFYSACSEIYAGALAQYRTAAFQQHKDARAMVEAMADRMYFDIGINLGENQDYRQWLRERGLDIEDFGSLEFEELWNSLWQTATGLDLNTTISLGDVHKAMVGIMTRLSSYSVHFVRDINEEPLRALPIKHLRIGDVNGYEERRWFVDALRLDIIRTSASEEGTIDMMDPPGRLAFSVAKGSEVGTCKLPFGLGIVSRGATETNSRVQMPTLRIRLPDYVAPKSLTTLITKTTSDVVVVPVGT